jgi:hypothetical protein
VEAARSATTAGMNGIAVEGRLLKSSLFSRILSASFNDECAAADKIYWMMQLLTRFIGGRFGDHVL